MDDEEFAVFEAELLLALVTGSVELAIVGGTAVRLHGYKRQRNDLDILIRPTRANAQAFSDALPARHKLIVPVERLSLPGARLKLDPAYNTDVLTSLNGVDTDAIFRDLLWVPVPIGKVPVISRQHLIKAKRASASDVDLDDAMNLA